ncbi:MAG: MFS transporter [Corynebacteriales bacterium]|nr:MFS transporter [Mycobacteriales bacterium]
MGFSESRLGLPRLGQHLLYATVVNALGAGFTAPFLLIYLHSIHGFSLKGAGAVLALGGAAAMLLGPIAGSAIDRFGAKAVYLVVMPLRAAAAGLLIVMDRPWHAFIAIALDASANTAAWSSMSAMLTGVTTPEQRQRVFSFQFMILNAGIGLGGVASGFIADLKHPDTFAILFGIDGISFLCAVAIVATLPVGKRIIATAKEELAGDTWLTVLKDRTMWWIVLAVFVVAGMGYAQLDSGAVAFSTQVSDVSIRVLGFAFAANTSVIVLGQLVALRAMRGRPRTLGIALFGIFAMAAFTLLGLSSVVGPTFASVLVISCAGVFALGETLWSPTINSLISEIAPANLRGRYLSFNSVMWSGAMMIGPLIAGVMLDPGWNWPYIGVIVVGAALLIPIAHHIKRRLTPQQNGLSPVVTPTEETVTLRA